MILKIDQLLKSDGWAGIVLRVMCEGLFFMLIFNAFQLSNWVENLLYGQSLIADPRKEIIVQRIALVLVSIGFFVEVVNSLRLLIASKRGSNLK